MGKLPGVADGEGANDRPSPPAGLLAVEEEEATQPSVDVAQHGFRRVSAPRDSERDPAREPRLRNQGGVPDQGGSDSGGDDEEGVVPMLMLQDKDCECGQHFYLSICRRGLYHVFVAESDRSVRIIGVRLTR